MGERSGGIADFLWNELRSAIADARSKLIDEGWFGRRAAAPHEVTAKDLGWTFEDPDSPLANLPASAFEEKFATKARDERAGPEPDHGHDIDR